MNDAPTAVNDTETMDEDSTVDINVLSNDDDVDGDPLTVTDVTNQPSNGTTTINHDNTITYTPNTNFNGVDTFAYQISDGNGGTSTATVTVNVGQGETVVRI